MLDLSPFIPLLIRSVGSLDACERVYANQSETGEARVAGSSSGGGGNAPLACKERWYFFIEAEHPQNVYYQMIS